MINKVTDLDFGKPVLYVPTHAKGDLNHPDVEEGVISEFNETFIFVKFAPRNVSNSEACNPADLHWKPKDWGTGKKPTEPVDIPIANDIQFDRNGDIAQVASDIRERIVETLGLPPSAMPEVTRTASNAQALIAEIENYPAERNDDYVNPNKRTCRVCAREFFSPAQEVVCSIGCAQQIPASTPDSPVQECVHCATELTDGQDEYCSDSCFEQSNEANVDKDCAHCGTTAKAHDMWMGSTSTPFCSADCFEKNNAGISPKPTPEYEIGERVEVKLMGQWVTGLMNDNEDPEAYVVVTEPNYNGDKTKLICDKDSVRKPQA